jgi:hypothetical protein
MVNKIEWKEREIKEEDERIRERKKEKYTK